MLEEIGNLEAEVAFAKINYLHGVSFPKESLLDH